MITESINRRRPSSRTLLLAKLALLFVSTIPQTARAIFKPTASQLWPGGIVRVCWETRLGLDGGGNPVNPHTRPEWAVLSAVVRDTMRSTWGRVANVQFTGFVDCPSNDPSAMGGWAAINLAFL